MWDFSGDVYLPRVRELCLAFPEAFEKPAHGTPTFRTRAMFAVYGGMVKNPVPGGPMTRIHHAVLFKAEPEERPALEQDPRFWSPAYYGPSGWLALNLDAAPIDWQEVAELVDASYRLVSGPRLLRRLDEQGSPARRPDLGG